MIRKIRSDAHRFPFLLKALRQESVATVYYMTQHDPRSAEVMIDVIHGYTVDQFLNRREGMWLSYVFAIPDPVDSGDSE
jgi:hypothetical protein